MKAADDLQTRHLVAQAAAWRLASLLLGRPRPEWKSEIEALLAEVGDREISACAKEADQGSEELYHRLFGPGGTVSPREVSYCGFEDPGHLMADLYSFYQAFSFQPQREESVDHISVEAGFVGYLFLKQAYAQMQENLEAVEITKSARERFTHDHVGRCARGMVQGTGGMPGYLRKALLWLAERGPAR